MGRGLFWGCASTFKKDFPFGLSRDRFLPIENENGVPCDFVVVLALHNICKSRVAIRHADFAAKHSKEYFGDSFRSIVEGWKYQPNKPEWLSAIEALTNLEQF